MLKNRELAVLQRAIDCMTALFRVSANLPNLEQFGLTSQIRRAAMSLHLNIAVGTESGSDTEFKRFLKDALRSTHEVTTALDTAQQLGYCKTEETQPLHEKIDEIASMIIGLSQSRH